MSRQMLSALVLSLAFVVSAQMNGDPNRLARTVVNRGAPAEVVFNATTSIGVVTLVVDVCQGDVSWRVDEFSSSNESAFATIFSSASAAHIDARFDTLAQPLSSRRYRVTFETTVDEPRAVVELRIVDERTRALLPPAWPDAAWFDPTNATINGLAAVRGATALYCAFGRIVSSTNELALATFESTCHALDVLTIDHRLADCVAVAPGGSDAFIAVNRSLLPTLASSEMLRIDLLVTLSLPSASQLQQTHVLHPILVAALGTAPESPRSIVELVTASGDRVAAILLGVLCILLAIAVVVLCVSRKRIMKA